VTTKGKKFGGRKKKNIRRVETEELKRKRRPGGQSGPVVKPGGNRGGRANMCIEGIV